MLEFVQCWPITESVSAGDPGDVEEIRMLCGDCINNTKDYYYQIPINNNQLQVGQSQAQHPHDIIKLEANKKFQHSTLHIGAKWQLPSKLWKGSKKIFVFICILLLVNKVYSTSPAILCSHIVELLRIISYLQRWIARKCSHHLGRVLQMLVSIQKQKIIQWRPSLTMIDLFQQIQLWRRQQLVEVSEQLW